MDSKDLPLADRRQFLKLSLGVAAGAAGVAMPGVVKAQSAATLRIGTIEAVGSPMTIAFDKVAALIKERSDGKIKVEHYPASQLGSVVQLTNLARAGTLQCTAAGFDADEDRVPEIGAGQLPYILKDEAHVDRVILGDLGKKMAEVARAKTGTDYVTYGEVGFRHLLSSRPVTNISEVAGLKLRVPEIKSWLDYFKAVNAAPTPLPYGEQYNALSTGIIQGLDSDPFNVLGYKWHEKAKHFSLTSHWYLIKCVRLNDKWMKSLPAELQNVVSTSFEEAFAEQRKQNRSEYAAAVEKMKADGVTVHQVTDIEEWRKRAIPVQDDYVKRFPDSKVFIDAIREAAV
jgi:C4-dicarboxylate-binding protein DctP